MPGTIATAGDVAAGAMPDAQVAELGQAHGSAGTRGAGQFNFALPGRMM